MPDLFDIKLPYFDVGTPTEEELANIRRESEKYGPCFPGYETYFEQGNLPLKGSDVKLERLIGL